MSREVPTNRIDIHIQKCPRTGSTSMSRNAHKQDRHPCTEMPTNTIKHPYPEEMPANRMNIHVEKCPQTGSTSMSREVPTKKTTSMSKKCPQGRRKKKKGRGME
jgi:hypothetical protein